MYTEKDYQIIKNIIIQDVPDVESIVVFGSYAKGTACSDSDLDILILLNKEYNWKKRHEVLNKIYRDTSKKGYLIDFLLKAEDKFNSDKKLPSLSRVIANEGKVLWTRT